METRSSLGVDEVMFHCIFCSSQSYNVQSTQDIETFHPGLGLDPDNECKKTLQPCKRKKKIMFNLRNKSHSLTCLVIFKRLLNSLSLMQ
jgi:hypothetical protein